MPALFTRARMPAERGGAARLNRREHAQLAKAQMASLLRAVSRARGADNVRDLECRTDQDCRRSGRRRPVVEDKPFKRAHGVLQKLGRDQRIDRRRLQLFVPQ